MSDLYLCIVFVQSGRLTFEYQRSLYCQSACTILIVNITFSEGRPYNTLTIPCERVINRAKRANANAMPITIDRRTAFKQPKLISP